MTAMTQAECARLGILSDRELADMGECKSSIAFIRSRAGVVLVDIPGTCDQYVVVNEDQQAAMMSAAMAPLMERL